MMKTSNPFMGSLAKNTSQHPFAQSGQQGGQGQQGFNPANPYATSAYGATQTATVHQGMDNVQHSPNFGAAGVSDRPMTVDDVVAKTSMTLGVIIAFAIVEYFLFSMESALAPILFFVGMIGGLITVMVATFGNKYGSAAVTLIYAAFEGLFVGGFSWIVANVAVSGVNAGALISQAILGTIGVFVGMLFVYKSGAIRVTPKFTRFMVGAMIGVLVLALGNLVFALFTDGAGPLRDGGPIAWIFSLVCIGLAAMSFLLDFDQADRLIRSGAPSKMAWGVALGLAVTLVWLYTEILRMLSYLQND